MSATSLLLAVAVSPPKNVVLFNLDDVGLGDVCSYRTDWGWICENGLATPHIDNLAQHGARFTSAHSAGANSAPSRAAIITGGLPLRGCGEGLGNGAWGLQWPATTCEGQRTFGKLFQDAGYLTAIVGKHLLGGEVYRRSKRGSVWVEKEHPLSDADHIDQGFVRGPRATGFDYSFVTPTGIQNGPYGFYEDEHMVDVWREAGEWTWQRASMQPEIPADDCAPASEWCSEPTVTQALLPSNEMAGKACLSGLCQECSRSCSKAVRKRGKKFKLLTAKGWNTSQVGEIYTQAALEFVEDAKQRGNHPFFLYFNSQAVHTPHTPGYTYRGKPTWNTTRTVHLDMMNEADLQVGVIAATVGEDDLFILTSDNGGLESSRDVGHNSQGPHDSGIKASTLEGGHHVPLVVSWPNGPFKTGVFPQLASQLDLFELFRVMLDLPFDAEQGRDSAPGLYRVLIEGPEAAEYRNTLVTQSAYAHSAAPSTSPAPS